MKLLQKFDIVISWDIIATNREVFLYLPFRDKGRDLWFDGVCALLLDLWGERYDKMFRGVEKGP